MKILTKKNGFMMCFSLISMIFISGCIIAPKISIGDLGDTKEGSIDLSSEQVTDVINIDVNLDVADLYIKTGDCFSVNYKIPEKLIPNVSFKDNTLTINGQDKDTFCCCGITKIDDLWSFGNKGSDSYKVELVIPENYTINKVKVVMNMGDVTFDDIKANNMDSSVDMGNLKLNNITCNNTENDVNMGDIKITNIKCNSIDTDVDMGNTKVSGDFTKIKAKANMGDVKINTYRPEKDVVIDVNVSLGDTKINGR